MSLYDVFSDLTRLETRLWDRVDASLRAEIEVPLGRFEAMLVMRRLGPCRVVDMAEALAITVGVPVSSLTESRRLDFALDCQIQLTNAPHCLSLLRSYCHY